MIMAGYCKTCGNPVGKVQVGTHCGGCGTLLLTRTMTDEPPEPATKQKRTDRLSSDSFSQQLFNRHKGINHGSSS